MRASVLDPPELYRTYSSPGQLNSPQGRSVLNVELINAGSAVTVSGVRIRGRTGTPPYDKQHVTAFTVQHSADETTWSDAVLGVQHSADETSWNDVDSGATFTGTSGNIDALFATPVKAQYIRITVQTWVQTDDDHGADLNRPSMRAGLLVLNVAPDAALRKLLPTVGMCNSLISE